MAARFFGSDNGNAVGFSYDLTAAVNAEDQLNFVINNRGDWGCDSTNFDPTIALSGGGDGVLAAPRNTPFTGSRISIPGTIEGENFDNGGADIAYHDTSAGSYGQDYDNPPNYPLPAFRQPTDVDIYKCGCYSGNYLVLMQAGDWMNYSVNITQAGYYSLDARVAWGGGATGNFHLEVDGLDVTGPIQIPDTNWGLTTVTRSAIQLPAGNHTMRVVADTNGAYSITGDIDYLRFTFDNSQFVVAGSPTTIPVHIDFDQLAGAPIPSGATINNQWLGAVGVKFYPVNPFQTVHTFNQCGNFCVTTSPPNFIETGPDNKGPTVVEFTTPVSNLNFFIIGVDAFFSPFAVLDVYRNGSFHASFIARGNGTTTIWVNLGTLDNITKIVIRDITDAAGIGFDDFRFDVPADVVITAPEKQGFPTKGGTITPNNQYNALVWGDVPLTATATPGLFSGGSYHWTFTGPSSVSAGSQVGPSVTVRSTDVGTINATLTYSQSGLTISRSFTINSVLPRLTNAIAHSGSDYRITPPFACGSNFEDNAWFFRLGCPLTLPQVGISFDARIETDQFISNGSQSGVKFVQAVSPFRRFVARGVRCITKRVSEGSIDSGWQLDRRDPYGGISWDFAGVLANSFPISVNDSPGHYLTRFADWEFNDAAYVDDRFEMYIVYYTGAANSPQRQRPLARFRWNWRGLSVFDWDGNIGNGGDGIHKIRSSDPVIPTFDNVSTMITVSGSVNDLNEDGIQCPDGPTLTNNRIDSAREFVKYHYIDFLSRTPYGDQNAEPPYPPDPKGWTYWTTGISKCDFDLACAHVQRVNTGFAFFRSGEFLRLVTAVDPIMANGPGTPNYDPPTYNRRFIFWMYKIYLQKAPDDAGWDFWTNDLNSNNNYWHIVDAFQLCSDYRDHRQFQ